MAAGRRQLFVYWRLGSADLAAAMPGVRERQRQLERAHAGLLSGLYRRSDTAAPEATLMETYAVDAGVNAQGVSAALQVRIEADMTPLVQPWLRGARHVEVFDAVDT